MVEEIDPLTTGNGASRLSHRGILAIMAVVIATGSIAGFFFGGATFGLGVIFGGALSFANYLWLDRSTRAMFVNAEMASTALLAAKYILRYFALGAVLLLIYITGAFPVAAVILGLSAFAFAVVLQGLKSIISSSF
jgi:hypothetical protein